MVDNDLKIENSTEEILVEVQEEQISVSEANEDITIDAVATPVINIEEPTAMNITVQEVSGVSSGTRIVVDHNASNPNQHTIGAITGLREELDYIKSLKTVYSNGVNVANYYEWYGGNASDNDGCFVSLVTGTSTIKICDGSDILGVSVSGAGFVGGQDALVPRDNSYGLIVNSGLVDVRCELDVEVGDYVISNTRGYAKKADSNYGYKVLAKEEKDGIKYAVILLGVQADVTNALGRDLDGIDSRLDAAETNIVSAINIANQAYNKANEVEASNQMMSGKVDAAVGKVDDMAIDVENLSAQVSSSTLVSAQAKAIAESAATSAESMKNEAIEKTNEALASTSELRKEFEEKAAQIDMELENALLELEDTKESIEETRDELQGNIDGVSAELESTKDNLNSTRDELSADIDDAKTELNNAREQLQSNIDSTSSELNKTKEELSETTSSFEELKEDLIPLTAWPDADNPMGVAGFVARANEDSATLGTIVTWQGETNAAMAAFKQEVADNYATIDSITQLKTETTEAITNVKQIADDNKASIDLITSWQSDTNESLSKVSQKADDNEASIKNLVSWKDSASKSISSIEQKTNKNEASINSLTAWQDEAKTAITNVEQKASDNEASITNLTAWQGTTNESIAKVEQQANDNESSIKSLTQWQGETTQSIAKVEEKANANESNITLLTEWKSDVEDDVESIASIKTQSDANKSSIESLTSWKGTASESLTSVKQQSDANKASIDEITLWQGETTESITEVRQQADDNASSIESLTSWKDDTTEAISAIEQTTNAHESSINSLTSWQDEAKTSIANVEQKASDNESKISSLTSWQGETSESIANVEQKATDNEAAITSLTTWKDEATESISVVEQTANQNSADISLITSWKSDVEDDVESIASIKTTADTNKASIEQLVKNDTELSTAIAGVKTTADANEASIEQITVWQNKVDPTINSVAGIKQTADGNAAKIEGLTSWQGDTNIAMARIEQKADANGAYIQSTVSNMDKYAVGPYSQAYGFTLEQAVSVLEEGMIYVPTESVTEIYTYDNNTQTYERTFTPGYLYKWGKVDANYRWITVDKNYSETDDTNTSSKAVYFATVEPIVSGNFGYWYTNGDAITGTTGTYEPYTLYKWESYVDEGSITQYHWVAVATLKGNSSNRAVSQIRQDANSIELRVTNVEGSAADSKLWIDENSANIQDVVSWHGDNGDSLVTFMQTAGDNFASASQVAKIVDKDGNVNAASIVTAVNDSESSVVIDADKIEFTGSQFLSTMTSNIADAKQEAIDSASEDVDEKLKNYSTTTQMQSAIDQKADAITLSVSETYTTKDEFDNLEIGGRNLLFNSQTATLWSNDTTKYPISRKIVEEDGIKFTRLQRTSIELNPTIMSMFGSFPKNTFRFKEMAGKCVTLSFKARVSHDTSVTLMSYAYGTPSIKFDKNGTTEPITTSWKMFTQTIESFPDLTSDEYDGVRFFPSELIIPNSDPGEFYLDVREWKFELGNRATDWTSAPEDIEASIKVNADNIELKVSKDGVISSINQTSETITIDANRLNLNGAVTISALGSDVQNKLNNTVVSTKILYNLSSSSTSFVQYKTYTWSETPPPWETGAYMWQRVDTTYNDTRGTVTGIPVCIQGAKGADGKTPVKDVDYFDGTNGENGTSIIWKGSFDTAPDPAENGWAYYDTLAKASYVYQNGWYQMSIDGVDGQDGQDGNDGISIVWKGESSTPPGSPQENWVYKDTDDGKVYIYNGTGWELMVLDGSDGKDGTDGTNGLSVFITYNDSDSEPGTPTGDGTANDWHTNATSNSIWMSQKVAADANSGTWGVPIKIKGETGTSITNAYTRYGISFNPNSKPDTWTNDFGAVVDSYLDEKQSGLDGIYIWSQEVTELSSGGPLYSTPTYETASSMIASWCDVNDKTLINGAHIATGTIDAKSVNVTDLSAFEATIAGWNLTQDVLGGELYTTKDGAGVGMSSKAIDGYTGTIYHKKSLVTPTVDGDDYYSAVRFYAGTPVIDNIRQFNNSKFAVLNDGSLYAEAANITGTINATSGTFSGKITMEGGLDAESIDMQADSGIVTSSVMSSTELKRIGAYKSHGVFFDTEDPTESSSPSSNYLINNVASSSSGYDTWISCHGHWIFYDMENLSDVKFKHDIETLDDRYDTFFDCITSRRFKYNDGTSDRYHLGYITQEIQESLRLANVSEQEFAGICTREQGTNEEFSTLRYNEFIALNTWQIQKLKQRVVELEAKINELTIS